MKTYDTLIVSPKFYPVDDGLGHYTTCFYNELSKHQSVAVATSEKWASANSDKEDVYCFLPEWKITQTFKIIQQINLINANEILFQYVPFMYSKRGGINFTIIFVTLYLKLFKTKKIKFMFHELHYPLQPNLKAMIMWFFHHLMLLGTAGIVDRSHTSTEFFAKYLQRFLPWKKGSISHLPVGSNISKYEFTSSEKEQLIDKYELDGYALIGCFGSFHPSKEYATILSVLYELVIEEKRKIKLIFIGANEKQLMSQFPQFEKEFLTKFVIATGYLEDEDVSKHLQLLNLFIGYFVDGVSSRRGSLLAALKNGIPVFSTHSRKTCGLFYNKTGVYLSDTNTKIFRDQLKEKLREIDENIGPQGDIDNFYTENFAWEKIVLKYLAA